MSDNEEIRDLEKELRKVIRVIFEEKNNSEQFSGLMRPWSKLKKEVQFLRTEEEASHGIEQDQGDKVEGRGKRPQRVYTQATLRQVKKQECEAVMSPRWKDGWIYEVVQGPEAPEVRDEGLDAADTRSRHEGFGEGRRAVVAEVLRRLAGGGSTADCGVEL